MQTMVYLAGLAYHPECMHGPDWKGEAAVTRADVRDIVRDELRRLGVQLKVGT